MADAPFVPFPLPAPSGGFWAKMAQGAQRRQFQAWTVLYVILCAPERTARSKTNYGAAVFSAPRNVRASGLSPPRFLACRRSECRQPDIFPTSCNMSRHLKNPGPKVDHAQPLRIPAAAGRIFAWAVLYGAIPECPYRAGLPSESGYGRWCGHLRGEPQQPGIFSPRPAAPTRKAPESLRPIRAGARRT